MRGKGRRGAEGHRGGKEQLLAFYLSTSCQHIPRGGGRHGMREEEGRRERGGAAVGPYLAPIPALPPYAIWISFQHLPRPQSSHPPGKAAPTSGSRLCLHHPRASKGSTDCGGEFRSQMARARIPVLPLISCANLTK